MPSRRPDAPPGDRIAKLLARAGIASRREVERMVAEGRIARDGVAIDTPATLLTSLHGVTVDGRPVQAPAPARLFVYHKPPGLLVTERDPKGRPTIYDRLPPDLPRVVPVGRLDLATEGLLLLTTDGGLKRQLELPATGVERAYRARAYGQVSQAQLEALIDGIEIEGVRYGPIDANLERRTGTNQWIELTLTEGKNREVRRVLDYLGLQVSRLIRIRYGPFVLGDLPAGAVGEVRQHDLVAFRQSLARGRPAEPDMARIAVSVPAPARPAPNRASPDVAKLRQTGTPGHQHARIDRSGQPAPQSRRPIASPPREESDRATGQARPQRGRAMAPARDPRPERSARSGRDGPRSTARAGSERGTEDRAGHSPQQQRGRGPRSTGRSPAATARTDDDPGRQPAANARPRRPRPDSDSASPRPSRRSDGRSAKPQPAADRGKTTDRPAPARPHLGATGRPPRPRGPGKPRSPKA